MNRTLYRERGREEEKEEKEDEKNFMGTAPNLLLDLLVREEFKNFHHQEKKIKRKKRNKREMERKKEEN